MCKSLRQSDVTSPDLTSQACANAESGFKVVPKKMQSDVIDGRKISKDQMELL